ncbi:MAG TPA: glycosyltransferase [Thermoanaerobaculia bacterium]|nr:glycosyltransferase [Thermoanaerobaculia bacterium]
MTSISVVVPSFQHARWIGEAVESALSQTRTPEEVVVVDDGSTDGTLGVLAGFGRRIRVLTREGGGRGSVGATYNRGVAAISSDLVAFLESDDALERTYLEETERFLEGKREFDWVSTARSIVDAAGRPTGEISRRRYPGDQFTFEGFLSGELGASSTPVVRRAALLAVGPYATDGYAADTDMALRFSLSHRMGYLDRPLYRYRRHGGNASASLLESVRLNVPILERLLEGPHPALAGREAAVRRALAKMLGMQAALAMQENLADSREDVLPILSRAARLHPSPKHIRRLALVGLFGPRAYGAWRRARAR